MKTVWLHCLLADKDVNRGQKEPEHPPMVLTHKDYTQTAFSSIVSPGHKKIKVDVEFHMEPCVHPLMVKFIVRQRKWIQADPHRCVKCNINNNQLYIGRILLWQHLFNKCVWLRNHSIILSIILMDFTGSS